MGLNSWYKNRRKVVGALAFLIAFPLSGFSQTGSDRWYFGNRAGVNFNTNPPSSLQDGVMNTFEGSATLTDAQGDLLLYTNGVVVYNRLHQQMPNGFGLWGDTSSFQAVVLVPKPGSDSLIYAFLTESIDNGSLRRFSYSVIDLTADNGLGDVVSKNSLLLQPVCEYLSAVQHANGVDYWVTVHEIGNANFYTYLVVDNGVSSTPVVSAVGPPKVPYNVNENLKGQLKFSPDGTRLAMPHDPGRFLAVFDFDAATGVVSNYKRLMHPGNGGYLFGVEFSPSGRYVYSAASLPRQIFQWDLISNDTVQIATTRQQIVPGFQSGWISALQLASNGKIYSTRHGQTFLGVINNPDLPGTSSNFEWDGIDLSPKNCRLGLPNCLQSLFRIPFSLQAQNFCIGDSTSFSAQTTSALSNYFWNFGDPVSAVNNTSTAAAPVHVFSGPGQYAVTLTAAAGNTTFTQSILVNISAPPAVTIFPSGHLQICQGSSGQLQYLNNPQASYQWLLNGQPLQNDTLPVLNVSAAGNYQLQIQYSSGCIATSNPVVVSVLPFADAMLTAPGPFSICPGNMQVLDAQPSTGINFAWLHNGQPIAGATAAQFTAASPGNYQVIVSGAGLCPDTSAAVQVNFLPTPPATIATAGPLAMCEGQTRNISAMPVAGATYQWLQNGQPVFGANQTDFMASGSGSFSIIVTDSNSCSATSQAIQITAHAYPQATILPAPTDFCDGETLTLNAPANGNFTYSWLLYGQPISGAASSEFIASGSGNFSVILTNAGICSDTSEVVVLTQHPLPQIQIEVIPGTACGDPVTLQASGGEAYSWSTGSTAAEITVVPVLPECYMLTGQNAQGCKTTVSIIVESDCPVVAPNIITPNGDGKNDMFALIYPIQDYDLQVYSRWGKSVFERKSYGQNQNWSAEGLPAGLYYYSIQTFKGEQVTGWLEVLK